VGGSRGVLQFQFRAGMTRVHLRMEPSQAATHASADTSVGGSPQIAWLPRTAQDLRRGLRIQSDRYP
jgi:hypothetical protein